MDESLVSLGRDFSEEEQILFESLVYFRFDDPTDLDAIIVTAHDIKPSSAEKRIRVYCNQFLYDVVEDITLRNYLNKAGIYYIYGENLRTKFPDYERQILHAYLIFWQHVQNKLKQLSEK